MHQMVCRYYYAIAKKSFQQNISSLRSDSTRIVKWAIPFAITFRHLWVKYRQTEWLFHYIHTSWYKLNPFLWKFIFWNDISRLINEYIYIYIYMYIWSTINRRAGWWAGWLAGWMAGCLAGWLADWLAGWPVGCSIISTLPHTSWTHFPENYSFATI